MFLIDVQSFFRHFCTPDRLSNVIALRNEEDPRRCASTRSAQSGPFDWSKKLRMPTLMLCLSNAPHAQSRFFTIGPPASTDPTAILLIGLPERNPFAPASNSSCVTLSPCMSSFRNVALTVPLNTLLPLFVTRLIDSPD